MSPDRYRRTVVRKENVSDVDKVGARAPVTVFVLRSFVALQ